TPSSRERCVCKERTARRATAGPGDPRPRGGARPRWSRPWHGSPRAGEDLRMADEDLRQLERAVAANPGDASAALALAHGLLRNGERRRAFLAFARLARGGWAEARSVVEGW